jgi:hypothetical protein
MDTSFIQVMISFDKEAATILISMELRKIIVKILECPSQIGEPEGDIDFFLEWGNFFSNPLLLL